MWTRGCRWKGRLVREGVQAQGWAPLVVGHQLEQAAALPLAQNLKSLPSLQSWYAAGNLFHSLCLTHTTC